jgi:hypothetical protein
MARTTVREEKIVEKPVIEETTTIRCDKCGREISDEIGDTEDDDLYPQTLEVALNQNLCVREGAFRRDYCRLCLIPIWNSICELIGADPDDISRSDYEDDDWL